jgi:hypothetical protein
VTVDPAKKEKFEELFRGMPAGLAGRVTDTNIFRIIGSGGMEIMAEDIKDLKSSFHKTFGGLL